MPLRIAFIGFNTKLTWLYFDQMVYANREDWCKFARTTGLLTMVDGTLIHRVDEAHPGWLKGLHFDQVILADDRRMNILEARADFLAVLRQCMARSIVPEEFRWLVYDLDYREEDDPDGKVRFLEL